MRSSTAYRGSHPNQNERQRIPQRGSTCHGSKIGKEANTITSFVMLLRFPVLLPRLSACHQGDCVEIVNRNTLLCMRERVRIHVRVGASVCACVCACACECAPVCAVVDVRMLVCRGPGA